MPNLLKRLELSGFKSFAEKTVFEFPRGITAIVGPNGSGKSNIIDAIRWLLGERDAKNLRGGKGEDLVFAGTPERPRMGLAQASLHFDNESGVFPVDFTEVVVMRQVSRDGASKYFLNKAEVRLKDLVDFFAQARLGSKGITVVTQGNSDMFIRALPLERRAMVEEVLGLKEYQLKKWEAERRLKNAEQNLEKAQALLEEIRPHLRSLRRQVGRWERRDEVGRELKELEDRLFGSQLSDLKEKQGAIDRELSKEAEARDALLEEREGAERALAAVEEGEPKEREELKAVQISARKMLEEKSELQKELGRLEAKIELEPETTSRLKSIPHEALRKTITEARDVLEGAIDGDENALRKALRKTIELLDAVFEERHGDRGDSDTDEVRRLYGELEEARKRAAALTKNIENFRAREKELESLQERFYVTFKEASKNAERARNMLREWERRRQEKELERERIQMRQEELYRHIDQAGRTPEEFVGTPSLQPEDSRTPEELERRVFQLRGELAAMGDIDQAVVTEAKETEDRYSFLERESNDLIGARDDLRVLIADLTEQIHSRFKKALQSINKEFQKFFEVMFGGGTAKFVLVSVGSQTAPKEDEEEGETAGGEGGPEEPKEEGIDIRLALPRKRIRSLDALSGGERSLVGIATLFALISVSPPPFLVLDEIDAALDERNARRFAELLKEFSKKTQFVIVTHNRATMEAADVLYGVTISKDGASKVLSVKLEETQE